jgi:hypothetical protein
MEHGPPLVCQPPPGCSPPRMQPPSDAFDPYDQWLAIPLSERPCDHYRLLGIPRFEPDPARITAAADARMALVRSYQVGPRGRYTQRLLNELSAAKVCLTSPAAKQAYDETLRTADQRLAAAPMMAGPMPPEPMAPGPVATGPMATRPMAAGQMPTGPLPPPVVPPVLPPPLAPRLPSLQIEVDESDERVPAGELVEPVPWWRPVIGWVCVALVALAAVTSWAIGTGLNRQSSPATVSQPESAVDRPEKPPPPDTPAVVQQQEASGEIHLALTTAALSGGVELIETDAGPALHNWSAEGARSAWQIALVEPGFFQLELVYATTAGIGESSLLAAVGEQEKRCRLRDTGGLDTFLTDTYTIALPKSGRHWLVLQPAALPAGGEIIVRSVRLIPVGGSAPAAR